MGMVVHNMEEYEQSKSHIWRTIDLGQHSLRWYDVDYQALSSEANKESTVDIRSLDQGRALTLDRLALCELEYLPSKQLPTTSVLDRPLSFPQWKNIDALASSPLLGAATAFEKQDGKLWVHTPEGEYIPSTLFSRWLNEVLTPPKTIGEEGVKRTQSLVWLNSSSQSPAIASLIYRCLSELPYTHGATLNRAIATLIGVGESKKVSARKGLWGVLDIGVSQGTWSLIEVSDTHIEEHLKYRLLKTYGRSFIGERGLRRTLLNFQLQKSQQSWSELQLQQRLEWLDYISIQADFLLKKSWPQQLDTVDILGDESQHIEIDQQLYELFQRYHHETYQGAFRWIMHSLNDSNVGPEALRGIYVTGKHALGMMASLKRVFRSVNVRIAPFEIELRGAQSYIESTLYKDTERYYIEEVTPFSMVIRDDEEGVTKMIFSEQSDLPCVHEIEVGPTRGQISLWLSSYGDNELKIASHPLLAQKRTLQVYFEGPHLFELKWKEQDSDVTQSYQWSTI